MLPGEGAKYKGYYGDRDDGGEGICCIYNKTRFEEVSCGRFWLWATDPGVPGKLTLNGDSANNKRIAVWIRLRDKSTGKEFVVSSVHIDNSNTSDDQAAGFPIMTWQVNTYLNNLQARSKGEDDLLPIIMGGDFNCGPGHNVIKNISSPKYDYADTRIAARNLKKPISYPDTSLAETDAAARSTMVNIERTYSLGSGYKYTATQNIYSAFDYIFMKRCYSLNYHKIHTPQAGNVVMSDHNPVTTEIVMKF
jgi:endonuclease/exonuclease/phosphatase family metal-dependent hydrolase